MLNNRTRNHWCSPMNLLRTQKKSLSMMVMSKSNLHIRQHYLITDKCFSRIRKCRAMPWYAAVRSRVAFQWCFIIRETHLSSWGVVLFIQLTFAEDPNFAILRHPYQPTTYNNKMFSINTITLFDTHVADAVWVIFSLSQQLPFENAIEYILEGGLRTPSRIHSNDVLQTFWS